MCLAVPVMLEKVLEGNTGVIMLSGVRREVDLSLIDDPAAGDYVLLHAGFAIEKLDAEQAERTLEMFRDIMDGEESKPE